MIFVYLYMFCRLVLINSHLYGLGREILNFEITSNLDVFTPFSFFIPLHLCFDRSIYMLAFLLLKDDSVLFDCLSLNVHLIYVVLFF